MASGVEISKANFAVLVWWKPEVERDWLYFLCDLVHARTDVAAFERVVGVSFAQA